MWIFNKFNSSIFQRYRSKELDFFNNMLMDNGINGNVPIYHYALSIGNNVQLSEYKSKTINFIKK